MPIVKVNNINIHYQSANDECEESIIALTGMFGNVALYYITYAPVLSKKYRVILVDYKSHGLSERCDSGYDLETMADDIVAFQKALGLAKSSFIGYSYGTLIALKIAAKYPAVTDKLALIDPPPVELADGNHWILNNFDRTVFNEYISSINCDVGERLRSKKRMFERYYDNLNYLCHSTTMKGDLKANHDFTDGELKSIRSEVFMLCGTKSECKPMGARLNKLIKMSWIEWFQGRDHLTIIDPPFVLVDPLCEFFSVIDQRRLG